MGSDDPNLIPGYIYFTQMTTSPEIPGADRFLQGCAKLFGPRSVGRPGEPLLFSILRLEGRDERVQTSGPGAWGCKWEGTCLWPRGLPSSRTGQPA